MDFPGEDTGMGNHFLLLGICLPDPGFNLCLLHGQADSLPLSPQGRLRLPCACMLSPFSRVQLFVTLWTAAHQAPLSMGFSRQECWSGLPCPPPGDLPDPGTEPESLMSPALAGRFFTTSASWEAPKLPYCCCKRTTQQIFIEFLKYVGTVLGGRTKQWTRKTTDMELLIDDI